MHKSDLKRSLEAELLKIERQDKKIYGVGETRYDLMIRDVLNYIDNSISKEVILDKIEDYKERMRYYEEEHIIVDDEYYRYETKVEILQDLLEGK